MSSQLTLVFSGKKPIFYVNYWGNYLGCTPRTPVSMIDREVTCIGLKWENIQNTPVKCQYIQNAPGQI